MGRDKRISQEPCEQSFMPILQERGRFWWNDQTIPNGRFAPDASVPGLLTIENDGEITLETDGMMNFAGQAICGIMQEGDRVQNKCIQGILRATDQHVLLIGIVDAGASTSTHGFSAEKYRTTDCLVHRDTFPSTMTLPTSARLSICLDGFEAWLQLRSITSSRSPESGRVTVEYVRPAPAEYPTDDGTLEFNFRLSGTGFAGVRSEEVSMKESVELTVSLKEPLALVDLRNRFRSVEDFLILLTGSHYRLAWPFITVDGIEWIQWYFRRMSGDDVPAAPKWHECWTHFPELRESFGEIWSNWKTKRELFGPGFYMYLGTLRGAELYTEHRFVNLIWGIESFDRTKYPRTPSASTPEMVKRVLRDVFEVRDQRWLRKTLQRALKYAHEPALQQRIFEVFEILPIDIDRERLRAFAITAANARNDISHFGAQREGSYNAFVERLHNLTEALSILYRCLLFAEIGIDSKIVKRQLEGFGGFESTRIRWYLAQVRLIDEAPPSRRGS